MLNIESIPPATGIENGSVKWNAQNRSDWPNREKVHAKGESAFSKLFLLDRIDPFSFRPRFPEILVECMVP